MEGRSAIPREERKNRKRTKRDVYVGELENLSGIEGMDAVI